MHDIVLIGAGPVGATLALAIAAATGAAFIRVNVHTGAMLTDQGIIEGDAYATLRRRAALAPEVLIFADHLVKHAVPLGDVDPVQAAKDLRLRGLADAVIVSGIEMSPAFASPPWISASMALSLETPSESIVKPGCRDSTWSTAATIESM